jgi:hypothetical protein
MAPYENPEGNVISRGRKGKETLSDKNAVLPDRTMSMKAADMRARWQRRLGQLTRTTVRGNVQPVIGQTCIVMTGVAGQDEGQMGVVTSRTKVMVEVTMVHTSGEGTITKIKQPRSLMLLEPGLGLVQDIDGAVWVRRLPVLGDEKCNT